jgi:cytochrome c oxidase subunit 2
VRGWSIGRIVTASAATTVLAFAAVSCGSDAGQSAADGGDVPDVTTPGGASVTNGEQLARSSGCAGCHGQNFGGGAGPSLVGLAGSEVTLVDGSTVIADTAYLTRSIAEPSADLVADYNLKMPANGLSDAEIADIVAFIETLADG